MTSKYNASIADKHAAAKKNGQWRTARELSEWQVYIIPYMKSIKVSDLSI